MHKTIIEKIADYILTTGYVPEKTEGKEIYHFKYNELPETLAILFKASLPKNYEFAEDSLITIERPVCSKQ